MKIIPICPASFAANTFLLVSGKCAIAVDPAVSVGAIEKILESEQADLKAIVLTHGHFDHTVAVDTLRNRFDVPLIMHEGDAPMLTDGKINGFFDFYGRECVHRPADATIADGEIIPLGDEEIKVISTPGHSPGSVCLLCESDEGDISDKKEEFMITGDTLFENSIGRCDLWRGSEEMIARSLSKLSRLDPSMRIYPGHGASEILGTALEQARYYVDF